MNILRAAKNMFDRLIRYCAIASTMAIVVIMVAIVLDVSLRWIKIPIYGVFELTGLLVGINIFLGLALTQAEKKHISVTFVSERMSDRARHALAIPLLAICTIFFVWLTYLYGTKAYEALVTGEVIQGYIPFPVFPLKGTMFFGVALLTIQLLFDIVTEAKALFSNRSVK